MIDEVIPVVKRFVEDDSGGDSLPVAVVHLSACFVHFVNNAGEHPQSCFCSGTCSPVRGILDGEERCSAPGTRDLREEPVLDRVVLGAVRRVMHHDNLHSDAVGKSHEILFHDMVRAGIGSAAVAEDDKHAGIGIACAEMAVPVVGNVVAYKLGSVVAGADGKVPGVAGDIVNAMRDNRPLGESCEVVVECPWRRGAEHASRSLEVADKLLVLRINADYRNAMLGAETPDHADLLKLGIPAFNLPHGDILTERPSLETGLLYESSDVVEGDVVASGDEFFPDGRGLDAQPHCVFVLRVAGHVLGHYLKKAFSPLRVLGNLVLSTASRLAYSVLKDARFLAKFVNSFDYCPCGNSEKRTQRLYRATIGTRRLACNKMPSFAVIECHKKRFFFFVKPYWGFLLQSCNYLDFNYKDTKISPVICYLKC